MWARQLPCSLHFLLSDAAAQKNRITGVCRQIPVSTKQEVPEKSEVPKKSADELKREKVEQYLADMTTEEKVAQLFVITPEAITDVQTVTAAGNATRKALEKYPVGGMVYMKANLVSEDQTKKLLENTKTMYKEIADLPKMC